ncbi:U32 family peptidase C-terminal domain-containing protein [Patescibacteria group bacterium]|nr:U32 family peptidase C-terminal domain-containing protein [Patescibacteria group bacterium]MCG2693397.1 U32 family peptidase C-terminal domain-containing protein [Candidatus Parcubacteria bacterium]
MTPELLAPAGNLKKLKYAIAFGADAVYLGAPGFSLRARINEFTSAKIKQGIEYAHARGVKVYITLNIFAHNHHLKKLPSHLKQLNHQASSFRPDALIISDPGILTYVKKHFPKIKIILSTQANVTNWQSAKFWYEQGVKRIILARELTLKEITEIHKRVPKLELECFVHGAMCMSYSGRCLLSKWINNREANLGDCSHPCRWSYDIKTLKHKNIKTNDEFILSEKGHPDIEMMVKQGEEGSYVLNSRDLCLIKHLDQLKKAGVYSFKIEGRTKSIYYLSTVTRAYRRVLDRLESPAQAMKDLNKLQTRGYSYGFLFGRERVEQNDERSHEKINWEFAGEVIDSLPINKKESKRLPSFKTNILVHNTLCINDKIEFIPPKGKVVKMILKKMWNSQGKEIQEAHGGRNQKVMIESNITFPKMAIIRRKL